MNRCPATITVTNEKKKVVSKNEIFKPRTFFAMNWMQDGFSTSKPLTELKRSGVVTKCVDLSERSSPCKIRMTELM